MQQTLHLLQMLMRGGAVIASMLVSVFPPMAAGADETRRLTINAVAIGVLGRSDLGIGMLDARAVISPHLMASVGVGVDIARSVSVDAYWTLAKEDHRTQASLFYVVLTAPIF